MVAHERLTEPRVTKECLLAKPRSFLNIHAFLYLNGSILSLKQSVKTLKSYNGEPVSARNQKFNSDQKLFRLGKARFYQFRKSCGDFIPESHWKNQYENLTLTDLERKSPILFPWLRKQGEVRKSSNY